MSSNDLVYTRESLAKDAADFAATAPTFLPVPDVANTGEHHIGDMANPVNWTTTKTGRVHLIRNGESWLVEFYAMIDGDLFLGCGNRRWMFNPLMDKITIRAPLMTGDLQTLKSHAEYLIEQA